MNMMEQVLELPSQQVSTKDNAMVRVDGLIFFQVMDAVRTAYEVSTLHLASKHLSVVRKRGYAGT